MTTTTKTEKKRILVVDDDASDTSLLKRYLEQNDYVIREENDARKALVAGEEFKPHLILLDVMMPEMHGGELAARFEAHPKLKNVPIIFLSARVTKEQVDMAGGRIGKYPFLAKPIVLEEVAACVKQHLMK